MTKRVRLRLSALTVAVLVLTLLFSVHSLAQAQSDRMPTDPEITIGQLPNGIHYYIRANKKPEKRAELRLVIKAGSVLEDEDQQGLAHLVEHMAFNGTTHFPKNEIVSFMESIGMRFGADVNAYTSFDETVYELTVPTDKPEVLDRALLILEDWAHNLSFDSAEIEKERGVVMEEWRLGRGANFRMLNKIFPVLLNGSRYATRIPIGKPEIIQNGKQERLKQFYKDWYRPDLMAVVAVGDFDKAAIEKLIATHFGGIPAVKSPRPRTDYDVPDHSDTTYVIATDKEANSTSVEVDTIVPKRPEGPVSTYRAQILDSLISGMLSARLSELAQKPDAAFTLAFGGRGGFIGRTKDSATLTAIAKEGQADRALDALLTEGERIARFGFTATELERQKQASLRNYERLALEKQNRESASRADEYVRNFLADETLPSADDEYALHKRFLPEITLEEANKAAKEWFVDRNRTIIVRAPEKAETAIPDQAKLAAVVKGISAKELKPYVDTATTATLLDTAPTPGKVVKTSTNETTGITQWELSNGVKVVLKPTTFKEDEILFRATSPGGSSLASDSDYVPAFTAPQVISAGGIGKLNQIDFRKFMTGKAAAATPFISEITEGLNGSSSRKDLETMFQLIYLRFTQPRADKDAFNAQTAQLKSLLANQAAVPEFAFSSELMSARYQNHPRRRLMTAEMVDQFNLDKSLAFYKDRFADASDFTFVFVGSFDLATMKPLIEKYLGALPSLHRKETWKDVGVRPPADVVVKKVEKGVEPKSLSAISFSGPFVYDPAHRVTMLAMAHILQRRLTETIREDLGGTYSVGVTPSYEKFPNQTYSVTITFGSAPDRTENLVKRVFEEIEKLKTEGPTDQQLTDEKEALLREYQTSIKTNNYLLSSISARLDNGEDVAGVWTFSDYYQKLDKAAIQEAAKTYLDTKRYVEVMLFPEKKQ
jgi:zinc protease